MTGERSERRQQGSTTGTQMNTDPDGGASCAVHGLVKGVRVANLRAPLVRS